MICTSQTAAPSYLRHRALLSRILSEKRDGRY
jgi:hypothetical protein